LFPFHIYQLGSSSLSLPAICGASMSRRR
jgi:hypothetical protein